MRKLLSLIVVVIALIGMGITPASASNPGLIATTGQINPFAGGFTVQIYNYDTSYTWTVTSSVGSASVQSEQ